MSIDSTVLRWQAEAERLKQALSDEKHMHACTAGDAQRAIDSLESRLAAAHALLARVRDILTTGADASHIVDDYVERAIEALDGATPTDMK